jgi:uncharacterized protein YeaO (DUF488 family)
MRFTATERIMNASRKHKPPEPLEDRRNPPEYSSPTCYLHEFESGRMTDTAPRVQIKRIYDPADPADGYRVLVDRLWPRGISKQRAAVDAWTRDLAPSTQLRQWFHHDRKRWTEFCTRYREELRQRAAELETLRQRASRQLVTLLYAAKDKQINHARVLRDCILKVRSSTRQPDQ